MNEESKLLGAASLLFKFPVLLIVGVVGIFGIGAFMLVFVVFASISGTGFETSEDPNLKNLNSDYCVYDLDDYYLTNLKKQTRLAEKDLDVLIELAVDYKVDLSIVLTLLFGENRSFTKSNFERKAKVVYQEYYTKNLLDINAIATHIAPLVFVGYEKDKDGKEDKTKPIYEKDQSYINSLVNYYGKLGPSMYCMNEGDDYLNQYVVTGDFSSPVTTSIYVTSPFGYRIHPKTGEFLHHNGVDLRCSNPDPILSVQQGTVVESYYHETLGNFVLVKHDNKLHTLYGHMSRVYVKVGDSVQPGTTLGACGTTGRSTGDHLHFEVQINGAWGQKVDPMRYYKFR